MENNTNTDEETNVTEPKTDSTETTDNTINNSTVVEGNQTDTASN